VQILVLVANSRAKTPAAEVEKGSVTTAHGHGLVDPKASSNCVKRVLSTGRKGTRRTFRDQGPRAVTRRSPGTLRLAARRVFSSP